MAPMIDCTLVGASAHSHPATTPAAEGIVSSVAADHDVIEDFVDDCGPHLSHCVITSIAPGAPVSLLLLQLLTVVFAVVAAASFLHSVAGGVRGPPVGALPAVAGRDILARFCIARR
ncbi:hypothetical protein AB0M12_05090 [Nocardia vinacea]|uniref:hypothetical protein n=1 Tax=Nocardia vinacea TaxID=96468 RepID=UPI00344535A4